MCRISVAIVAYVIGFAAALADDDIGKQGARDLNDATREAGQSYQRYLPTWLGGKAIEDQNQRNDRELEDDD